MQNLGGQTKSIMVFSELAYCHVMYKEQEFYHFSVENVSNALPACTLWLPIFLYFRDISNNRIKRLFSKTFAGLSSLEIL